MTNFEYYKDQLKCMADNNEMFAMRAGKITGCVNTRCKECDFHVKGTFCRAASLQWLCKEHKVTPKLTAKEYDYLSFLEEGYMVRSKGIFGEDIRVYFDKPNAGMTFADRSISWYGNVLKALINANVGLFDFVKVDDEPYSIEEMLTWEHEEE